MKENPLVSIIICTYSEERFEDFIQASRSAQSQTYSNTEIVLVIEGDSLYQKAQRRLDGQEFRFIKDEGSNLAEARNIGGENASGDILAYTDDDVILSDTWAENIVKTFKEYNVAAVTGPSNPIWVDNERRPTRLPREFGWLVGITDPNFDTKGYVRNGYGCNLSIEAEAFQKVNGFDPGLGKDQGLNLQAEDADICSRIQSETNKKVYFNPDVYISHKVYSEQLSYTTLINRAYLQGYTKSIFQEKGNEISTEQDYLKYILFQTIPRYLRNIFSHKPHIALTSVIFVIIYTIATGLGFLRGRLI